MLIHSPAFLKAVALLNLRLLGKSEFRHPIQPLAERIPDCLACLGTNPSGRKHRFLEDGSVSETQLECQNCFALDLRKVLCFVEGIQVDAVDCENFTAQ